MQVSTIMDTLGTRLATITGLRVLDFPPASLQPPAAFVDLPEEVLYDSVYGRAADEAVFIVTVVVGNVVDRSARDALVAYMDGTGAKSIKAALDSGNVRVVSCRPLVYTSQGIDFLAAEFSVAVIS